MLEDNLVSLTVEVDEAELASDISAAFRRIGRQVRIPGFRPGKAPQRVLEAKLGHQAGRDEAFRACLPRYYRRAVVESGIDVIDNPEIEIISGHQFGPLQFKAAVQVRPEITISGYENLRIVIPNPEVTTAEIEAEIDALRRQFADLSVVNRPAIDGDHVKVDITCTSNGELVDSLTASDYDYELGRGAAVAEIDENLQGSKAGDILMFNTKHLDPESADRLEFRVLVKEVRETVMPPLDDKFVAANSECETVEELREVVQETQSATKKAEAVAAYHDAMNIAIAELVTDPVPDVMIESVVKQKIEVLNEQMQQRGATLEDYLRTIGQSEDEFLGHLRKLAEQAVQIDLALRAVATAEGLEATDEDLKSAVSSTFAKVDDSVEVDSRLNEDGEELTEDDDETRLTQNLKQVEKNLESLRKTGVIPEMKATLSKQAAMKWITERLSVVDPEGSTIDTKTFNQSEPEDS